MSKTDSLKYLKGEKEIKEKDYKRMVRLKATHFYKKFEEWLE